MDVFPINYTLSSTELPPTTLWLVAANIGDTPLDPNTFLIWHSRGCPPVVELPIVEGDLTSYRRPLGPWVNLQCVGRQSEQSSLFLFLAYYPSGLDSCGCLPPHLR